MDFKANLADAVGNTPLIKLRAASEATGCTILGKAEFLNPGQSVKDRAALFMIRDAVAKGTLREGGTIVEGTAGNTGIGLTLVGASMGFKSVIVIPETQSQEKKDMLRLAGAELVEVPAVPYSNPNNYVKYSARLAEALDKTEPNGAVWANQFDNTANRQAHVDTTAPEIWAQTDGKIDGFTCACGSGGTLAGVAEVLQPKGVKVALSDPYGSGLYKLYTGEQPPSGDSISEGIGQGRITANLEGFTPDFAYKIPDEEALPLIFDLLRDEGLCMGGSTAINIAGAIRLARELGIFDELVRHRLPVWIVGRGRITRKELKAELKLAKEQRDRIRMAAVNDHASKKHFGKKAGGSFTYETSMRGGYSGHHRAGDRDRRMFELLAAHPEWKSMTSRALADHLNTLGIFNKVTNEGREKPWTLDSVNKLRSRCKRYLEVEAEMDLVDGITPLDFHGVYSRVKAAKARQDADVPKIERAKGIPDSEGVK